MSHLVLTIIFVILLFPGIFLVLIPLLPVMSYMFAVALIYGLIDSFEHLKLWEFAFLGLLFYLSIMVDYSAGILGAKYAGASRKSMWWGLGGLIVGSILFPPFGGIPGLFLSVFACETYLLKTSKQALKSALGSVAGAVTGVALNLLLAISFFVFFIIFSIF